MAARRKGAGVSIAHSSGKNFIHKSTRKKKREAETVKTKQKKKRMRASESERLVESQGQQQNKTDTAMRRLPLKLQKEVNGTQKKKGESNWRGGKK
jgi:hypothetical protein